MSEIKHLNIVRYCEIDPLHYEQKIGSSITPETKCKYTKSLIDVQYITTFAIFWKQ